MKKISHNLILSLCLLRLGKQAKLASNELESILDISLRDIEEIDGGCDGIAANRARLLCMKCNTSVSELYKKVETLTKTLGNSGWNISNDRVIDIDFFTLYELFELINQAEFWVGRVK